MSENVRANAQKINVGPCGIGDEEIGNNFVGQCLGPIIAGSKLALSTRREIRHLDQVSHGYQCKWFHVGFCVAEVCDEFLGPIDAVNGGVSNRAEFLSESVEALYIAIEHYLFESFASFDPTLFGASSTEQIPSFGFSDAANQLFVAWQTELNTIKIPREDNPVMRQHLGKYDKLFCSIALLMHILDCVEQPNAEGMKTGEVSEAAARRAAAWCLYLEHHARRVYGLLIGQDQQSALALSVRLQQGRLKDGFTARDVQRNDWQHLATKEHIAAALDWLVDAGWLRQVMIETGGRPSITYLINPNIPLEVTG